MNSGQAGNNRYTEEKEKENGKQEMNILKLKEEKVSSKEKVVTIPYTTDRKGKTKTRKKDTRFCQESSQEYTFWGLILFLLAVQGEAIISHLSK